MIGDTRSGLKNSKQSAAKCWPLLREQKFQFHHLGPRVLRTETACTAALSIVRAKLGLM